VIADGWLEEVAVFLYPASQTEWFTDGHKWTVLIGLWLAFHGKALFLGQNTAHSSMNLDLVGKNALVCGSSKGIGKAIALELASLGANVTLVARSASVLATVVSELDHSKGQKHDFLQADFADSIDLRKRVSALTSLKDVHILINNTGGPASGPLPEANTDQLAQAFHNHLICNHLLVQAVLPGMKKAGYGRIVNIISTSVKAPLPNLGVSNTVRAAVANWAKTLANELASEGITVNNVLPGATDTDRLQEIIHNLAQKSGRSAAAIAAEMQEEIPMQRFAAASEIAAAAAFLASPAAAYITGTNLTVDGGRSKSW
jgi:3-oxoacyl-[acyl-carrier protein] reductase